MAQVVAELPEEFRSLMDNVDIVVADHPSPQQRQRAGRRYSLLGLYEGVPRTQRGVAYGLVPPDKITVFQPAIEGQCASPSQIAEEVRRVVVHEIAHHFGLSDAELARIERARRRLRPPA